MASKRYPVSKANRKPRRTARNQQIAAALEELEVRRLLSTINWSNRGTSDNFGVFGANANQARTIVDRAIADWQRVVNNFNFFGGGNTHSLMLQAGNTSGSVAFSTITALDPLGKPTASTIVIDQNAAKHFLDPTPSDDAEFAGNVQGTFAASGTFSTFDLYTTVLHELGHSLGLVTGAGPRINQFLTDTGIDDPNSATAGNLWAFNVNGGPIEATFTKSDPGHLWEGPATAATNNAGLPVHRLELMNPGRALPAEQRTLISDLDAAILRDAYGYTVTTPSTINTMHTIFNETTGVLTVSGLGTDDQIKIDLNASNEIVTQVNGMSERMPAAAVTAIFVNAGGGSDSIDVINTLKPVTVNGGTGDDALVLAGAGSSNLDFIRQPVTFVGGAGSDSATLRDSNNSFGDTYTCSSTSLTRPEFGGLTYTETESLQLDGGVAANTLQVNSLANGCAYTLLGGGGDDFITIGNGNIVGNLAVTATLAIDGQAGNDFINLSDVSSADTNDYGMNASSFAKYQPGGGPRVSAMVSWSNHESLVLACNAQANFVRCDSTSVPTTISGNNGDDSIWLGYNGGNLADIQGATVVNGGAGNDRVVAWDDFQADNATYEISNTTLAHAGAAAITWSSSVETLQLECDQGNSVIFVDSLAAGQAVDARGNNGNDSFWLANLSGNMANVAGNTAFTGGAGTDTIYLDDDDNAGTDTYQFSNSTLSRSNSGQTSFAEIDQITAFAEQGSNVFSVVSTATPISIYANGGDDTFNINLASLGKAVNVFGQAGNDTVNTTNSTPLNIGTFTVASTFVTRFDAFPVNYDGGLELLKLTTTNSNDMIDVNSTAATTNVQISTLDGADTITLGTANLRASDIKSAVTIDGGVGSDLIWLRDDGNTSANSFIMAFNTIACATMPTMTYAFVEQCRISGGTQGDVFEAGGQTASAEAFPELLGNGGVDTFNIRRGVTYVNSGAGDDVVNVGVNIQGGFSIVRFLQNEQLGSLAINSNGVAETPIAGDRVLSVKSINVAPDGAIDLFDNDMLLDYAGSSPISAVQGLIRNGRNGGFWGGFGIRSTSAQVNPNHNTTLGSMEASDFKNLYGPGAAFDGQSIDNTAVLIKYTYYGDADFNGVVNFDDYSRIDAGFSTGRTGWLNGDFDGSGVVNFDDYSLIDLAFNTQGVARRG